MKNSRANSLFQGKRKLLKTPECKKYIQYSEQFQGNSVFSGQVQVIQESWMIKRHIQHSEKFQGNSVFQGKH